MPQSQFPVVPPSNLIESDSIFESAQCQPNQKSLSEFQNQGMSVNPLKILSFQKQMAKKPSNNQKQQIKRGEDIQEMEVPEVKKCWTQEEQRLLIQIHNSIGNCWTEIGNKLRKDHNTVKNHFYAEIRKAIRRINFFIAQNFIKEFKELNLGQISKTVTLLSEKKKVIPNLSCLNNLSENQISQLKLKIFNYAKFSEQDVLSEVEKEDLIDFLREFNMIINLLKDNGLIGKKISAYKQARQAKSRRNNLNPICKSSNIIQEVKNMKSQQLAQGSLKILQSRMKQIQNSQQTKKISQQAEKQKIQGFQQQNGQCWSNYNSCFMTYPLYFPSLNEYPLYKIGYGLNPVPLFFTTNQTQNFNNDYIFMSMSSPPNISFGNNNNYS